MTTIDYNGEGKWSREAILQRYAEYCAELGVEAADLSPMEDTDGIKKWVYPVMDEVIKHIEQGDAACRLIGIEFIEEDQSFSFGAILKSNTARALRRADLSEEDKERIRKRIVDMLARGYVPHEYKEYAKLLRKVGLGGYREQIEACTDASNLRVARYARYFLGAS